jgi:hypothetical protein
VSDVSSIGPDSRPVRVELARSHLLYGEWLRRERRRGEAREQLRAADQMLDAMGIKAFAERARRELLAVGETAGTRAVRPARTPPGQATEPLTAQEAQVARLAGTACQTPRSAPGCSSARVQSGTTWVRSSPGSTSAHAVSSTASCPAIRIPPSFLFDRVQQLPAGLLATAAGLGAHPAVLMHPGMPFALVAAALTYRRANPKERLGNYGVVLRLAA